MIPYILIMKVDGLMLFSFLLLVVQAMTLSKTTLDTANPATSEFDRHKDKYCRSSVLWGLKVISPLAGHYGAPQHEVARHHHLSRQFEQVLWP